MMQRILLLAKAGMDVMRTSAHPDPSPALRDAYCKLLRHEEAVCTKEGKDKLEDLTKQLQPLPRYNEETHAMHVEGPQAAALLLVSLSTLLMPEKHFKVAAHEAASSVKDEQTKLDAGYLMLKLCLTYMGIFNSQSVIEPSCPGLRQHMN